MKNRIVYLALFITSTNLLSACGGGDGFGSSNPNTRVVGTWETACVMESPNYSLTRITFADGEVDSNKIIYSDSSCTTQTGTTSSISGPYIIGGSVATSNGVTAYELDVTVTLGGTDTTLMDILRVEGETLYLSGQASFQIRPTTLDYNKPYLKQ